MNLSHEDFDSLYCAKNIKKYAHLNSGKHKKMIMAIWNDIALGQVIMCKLQYKLK